jgi:hypothetical protein
MRDARAVRVRNFAWSARERREADLFLADLLGHAPRAAYGEDQPSQVCGFFRSDNSVRTMSQLRTAIVLRCTAEWSAWHTGATPKPECDATLFGRLIGYYLSANPDVLPDTLTRIRGNALATPATTYGPLRTPTRPNAAQIAAVRTILLAGAPGTIANITIEAAMAGARQGHRSLGSLSNWSGAFVSACVRTAAIAEGIESVVGSGRTHFGRNVPLQLSRSLVTSVTGARDDQAAGRPGRYHAFLPSARVPQVGDIIVQDRRDGIGPDEVNDLPTLPVDAEIHGDIVVEVSANSVVTIGGNVADTVRRRRFPRGPGGFLVTAVPQLYSQEDDAGVLPSGVGTSCHALADKSTKRIFALLSLVEECRPIPSGGGSGSGSGSGSGAPGGGSGSGRP